MTIKNIIISASIGLAGLSMAAPAHAGIDPLIGEIMEVGFTFCPRGWANADGQLIPISQNQALFSLIGTTYGGDGRTTFALPDLRGRVSIHTGSGPGLANRSLGAKSGTETTTLSVNDLPNHTHNAGIRTVGVAPNDPSPAGNSFAVQGTNAYNKGTNPGPIGTAPRFMNPETVWVEGTCGSQAHNNMQPFLTTRKCIALQGVFPSRN